MWEFFDRKVCLTADEKEWELAQTELLRIGLHAEKFKAIPDIGPHQSFNRSTRQMLIEFYESKAERLLFLEDDVQFINLSHLERALQELPTDFDICYLGGNIIEQGFRKPEKYSKHLCRVYNCWTTHAICYDRKVIPFILENQPGFSERMFDNWLSDQLSSLKAYIVNPMVAVQRSRISSIWNTYADYTDIFESSNKIMA